MNESEENPLKVMVVTVVLLITLMFCIAVASGAFNVWWTKTFGVEQENARREVFEETESHRSGSFQRLGTLCIQVADAKDKRLLNGVIVHEFQKWDVNKVPAHLQPCLNSARAGN
ncbi:MAG: hypothetical protein ACKVOE_05735 [Rickettsiales bacterium]